MASMSDKNQNYMKARKLSFSEAEAVKSINGAENSGIKLVDLEKKYNSEISNLRKNYKEDSKNFIFGGTVSDEYMEKLFSIYKKYNKTKCKTIEDFKKSI